MKTRTGNLLRIAALLIAVISAAAFMTVPQAFAKSSMRLSAKKITLTAGKSRILKLSGTSKKAKWYISGKKLVTVRAKGSKRHKAVIKAGKKAGTCYVKVKFGKKTLKCKVIVKAAPKKEDEFKERPLSGTAEDRTAEYKAETVTGKETDDTFKKAMADTSLKLLKYLCSVDRDKNVLISPDSIFTAMAMAENGAKNSTLEEMEKAFGNIPVDDFSNYLYTFNNRLTSSKKIKYHVANSIWYRKNEIDILEEFLQKNVNYFNSQVFAAPFSPDTVSDINNWVYNNTRGMIPSIIDNLSEDSVTVLLNAIAFEGKWAEQYYDGQVQTNQPFYNEDGSVQKKVTMLTGTENTYVEIGGAKGFIKPYEGGEIAFVGLETPEGMTVDEFVQSLSGDDFINGFKNSSKEYEVSTRMPQFKYDYGTSLVDALRSLGINSAFIGGLADFTGMTPPDQPVNISDVIHKTHIELDKNGTKAAAVTAVVFEKSSLSPDDKRKTVKLDHPFVYAIIDNESGIPLFIGTVKTV